jgi:hypothetical protein
VKVAVVIQYLRLSERDKPLVLSKELWLKIVALAKKHCFVVQDHLSVFEALKLARALTAGLNALEKPSQPVERPATRASSRFLSEARDATFDDPDNRKIVKAIIAMCEQGRGLHFQERITWD